MRKLLSFCIALLLAVSLAVPASATITGFLYDDANILPTTEVNDLILRMDQVSQQTGIAMELYVMEYAYEEEYLSMMADVIYDNKEAKPEEYISVWVQIIPDAAGMQLSEDAPWHLKMVGSISENTYLAAGLKASLEEVITAENWSGALAEDQATFNRIGQAMMDAAVWYDAERSAPSTPYVMDHAYLLTPEQRQELNAYAESIADEYGIGVYVMSVPDFHDYGEEPQIFDVLWNYYHDNSLGYGEDREGMILMLSMADRDWATFYYGENTEYAFNGFGQKQHETYFLDDFGSDDWYGGFHDYLTSSEDFLSKAAAGEPVRDNPWHLALVFILIAWFIAFVVTRLLWMRMANVAKQKSATRYVSREGLVLTHQKDIFLHQTERRRRIERSDSDSSSGSGSRAHTGGGGSGRSGKF